MSVSFFIDRLGPGDVDRMRSVLGLYAEAFEEPETYLDQQPEDAYLLELLARDDFIQIAAFENGRIAGALSAYILPKFEQARSEIYIYDLAVAVPNRRRGVATRMIEALKPIAKKEGAWVIYVQANSGDAPPIALYGKLGEREEVFHFDISPENPE